MITIRHAVGAAVRAAAPTSIAAISIVGLVRIAEAQQPPTASTTAAPVTLEEVTVTGSRIKRTTDFNTPTPTTVIDTATMESMGLVNVGAAATIAPANVSTFTPANTGNSNFFTGAYIADLRGLNPFFGSRTLVLLDGQRVVQTEQGDQFDLNFVPHILVSRIDTVTGGASAAYGSGAIAGVENVILDTKLEGVKLEGDFYETSHSDGRDRHVGGAFGHGFLDGRVHFVIGAEYENQDAIGCVDARSWCAANVGTYQLPGPPIPGGGFFGFGADVRSNTNSPTGVFLPSSQYSLIFPFPIPNTPALNVLPTGNGVVPFNLGQGGGAPFSFANDVVGGDGVPIYQYSNLQAPVNRGVGMAQLTAALTDNINFKTSFYVGKVTTTNYNGNFATFFQNISSYNAFGCPGNVFTGVPGPPPLCNNPGAPGLAAAIGGGLDFFNKDWSVVAPTHTTFDTNLTRFTFGFDGKIGDSSWSWDANYEYGLTNHSQLVTDTITNYSLPMALDSIIGPNGQPECRVSYYINAAGGNVGQGFANYLATMPGSALAYANPNLAVGCVPINPFGTQPLSPSALNYSFGNLLEQLRYTQTDVSLNISGNYFRGVGAGPFSVAGGYEWRQERGDNIDQPGAPPYAASNFVIQYGSSFGGVVTVNEEYLETNLPLVKDVPGVHLLELDVAGRESQYDNSALYGVDALVPGVQGKHFTHNLTTWKVSAIWEPFEAVRFRGSYSRDARAPNFRELYYNQTLNAGGLFGQCGPGGSQIDPCTWHLLGNVNLAPETSKTYTAGVVLTPKDWVPGLQFSADWFHIRITNAIEQANPTLLEAECRSGDNSACSQMSFNAAGLTAAGVPCAGGAAGYQATPQCFAVASISPTAYNGAFYDVRGVDFSLNYLQDIGPFGTINTRALATWMGNQQFAFCTLGAALGCYTTSILGQTGIGNTFLNDYTPTARWRGSLLITWARGPFSITPNLNFVSTGIMDYNGVTPAQYAQYSQNPSNALYPFHVLPYNRVPSYVLVGLNATYSFQNMQMLKGLQLFGQVNNLFNKTPPYSAGDSGFFPSNTYGGTNPIFFDTAGLAYRVGFRLSF